MTHTHKKTHTTLTHNHKHTTFKHTTHARTTHTHTTHTHIHTHTHHSNIPHTHTHTHSHTHHSHIPHTHARTHAPHTHIQHRSICSCSTAVYKPVWHIPLLSVQWINPWWWTDELSETCRVSWQNKFVKLVHIVGFIINKKDYILSLKSKVQAQHSGLT